MFILINVPDCHWLDKLRKIQGHIHLAWYWQGWCGIIVLRVDENVWPEEEQLEGQLRERNRGLD